MRIFCREPFAQQSANPVYAIDGVSVAAYLGGLFSFVCTDKILRFTDNCG